jgi:hypothetical protein
MRIAFFIKFFFPNILTVTTLKYKYIVKQLKELDAEIVDMYVSEIQFLLVHIC